MMMSSTSVDRLNYPMTLQVHKERLDVGVERARIFGRVRVRVGSGFQNLGPAGPGPGPL